MRRDPLSRRPPCVTSCSRCRGRARRGPVGAACGPRPPPFFLLATSAQRRREERSDLFFFFFEIRGALSPWEEKNKGRPSGGGLKEATLYRFKPGG